MENQNFKIIQCIMLSENMKCLGVNLTKDVQKLYTKNYKTLREMKENLIKWKVCLSTFMAS